MSMCAESVGRRLVGCSRTWLVLLLFPFVVGLCCAAPDNVALLSQIGRTRADGAPNFFQILAIDGCEQAVVEIRGAGSEPQCQFHHIGTTASDVLPFVEDPQYFHILAIGFAFAGAINELAPQYPNVTFSLVDEGLWGLANGQGLLFGEQEAGFLAGALAGMATSSQQVGIVAGVPYSPLVRFLNGFLMGTKYVCPQCGVFGAYHENFENETMGIATASSFLDSGCDVIFGAAGSMGSSAISWAAEQGAWVIGVDVDEATTTFFNASDVVAGKLLSSAEKRVDVATYLSIKEKLLGTWEAGNKIVDLSIGGITMAACALPEPCDKLQDEVRYLESRELGRDETGSLVCPIPRVSTIVERLDSIRLELKSGALTAQTNPAGFLNARADVPANVWSRAEYLGPVMEPVAGHSLVLGADNVFYMFGGEGKDGAVSTLLAYHFDANHWHAVPAVGPSARYHHVSEWVSGALLVFAGSDGGVAALDDLWAWRPAGAAWESVAVAGVRPAGRFGAASCAMGGSVYVLGGVVSGAATAELWRLDVAATQWIRLPDAPQPLAHAAVACLADDGQLLVYGGESRGQGVLSSLRAFDVPSGTWAPGEEVTTGTSPGPLKLHRLLPVPDGRLFVVGGQTSRGDSAAVFSYNPATRRWRGDESLASLPGVLHSHAAAAFVQSDYANACVYAPVPAPWTNVCVVQERPQLLVFGGVAVETSLSAGGFTTQLLLYFPDAEAVDAGNSTDGGASGAADATAVDTGLAAGLGAGGAALLVIVVVALLLLGRHKRRALLEQESRAWRIAASDIQLDEKLGEGAHGVVFKATFRGTPVAVKTWKVGGSSGLELHQRSLDGLVEGGLLDTFEPMADGDGQSTSAFQATMTAMFSPGGDEDRSLSGSSRNTLSTRKASSRESSALNTQSRQAKEEIGKKMDAFRREIEVMVKLRHPNITLFMGAVMEGESMAIVQELMSYNLFEKLRDVERKSEDRSALPLDEFPLARRVDVALDACRGMEYLHGADPPILHLDLKSPNLLLDALGRCKVADFGLATLRDVSKSPATLTGSVLWLPPEAFEDGRVRDTTDDAYAFAIVLWELAACRIPYQTSKQNLSVGALILRVTNGTRPEPAQLDYMPPGYCKLFQDMWQGDRLQRPTFQEATQRLMDMVI